MIAALFFPKRFPAKTVVPNKAMLALLTTLLMCSLHPEVRVIGVMFELIGLDMLLFFLEANFLAAFTVLYHGRIRPSIVLLKRGLQSLGFYHFTPVQEETEVENRASTIQPSTEYKDSTSRQPSMYWPLSLLWAYAIFSI